MKTCLIIATLLFIFTACDTFQKDELKPEPIGLNGNIVTLFNEGSGVIDLQPIFSQSQSYQYSLSEMPKHGQLRNLNGFLVQYSPNPGISSITDSIGVNIYSQSNTLLKKDYIILKVLEAFDLPCGAFPKNDIIDFPYTSSLLNVNVLDNDILCGASTNYTLSIAKDASMGSTQITPGNLVQYTPTLAFHNTDTIIYKITSNQNPGHNGLGIVYVNANPNIIVYSITGVVDSILDVSNALQSKFKRGDVFTGVIAFDISKAAQPGNILPSTDFYDYSSGANGVSIKINGYEFTTSLSSAGSYFDIQVSNDYQKPQEGKIDLIQFTSGFNNSSNAAAAFASSYLLDFTLTDYNHTAITDTHKPMSIDLNNWAMKSVTVDGFKGNGNWSFSISGSITSIKK